MYTSKTQFSVSHYCKHLATVSMNCTYPCSTEPTEKQFQSPQNTPPPPQNRKNNPNKLLYSAELLCITGMGFFLLLFSVPLKETHLIPQHVY